MTRKSFTCIWAALLIVGLVGVVCYAQRDQTHATGETGRAPQKVAVFKKWLIVV